MSNSVGHTLPQQALFRPSIVENQCKARQGVSANYFCSVPSASKADNASHSLKPLLSARFLGRKLSPRKGNPLKQNTRTVTMSPRAVLAADPASEASSSHCYGENFLEYQLPFDIHIYKIFTDFSWKCISFYF